MRFLNTVGLVIIAVGSSLIATLHHDFSVPHTTLIPIMFLLIGGGVIYGRTF